MKYKNFKWKFANSVMIPLGISFGLVFVVMLLLLLISNNLDSIPFTIITIVIAAIPTYFLFLLIGDILYHKSSISIKDEGIYQNKRLLKYQNIKRIYIGKMGQIYSFQVEPIKDGAFVSQRILLYFYSLEEVYHFIIVHNFTYALSYDYQYYEVASFIKSIINTNGEDIHPDFIKFFNEQKTTCDCCLNKTIFKRIPHDTCPVCYWKKDQDKNMMYNPNYVSNINQISLVDAKSNYEKYGACKEEYKDNVRSPFSYELPDYDENKQDI